MEHANFLRAHWLIVISGIVTLAYLVFSACKGKLSRDSLVNVFSTFLAAASIMSGVKLALLTLLEKKLVNDPVNIEESEVVYTIIGGCVVAWVAMWELVKQFRDLYK